MDAFHQRLIEIGLDAAAQHGFALAGGYAVQAHEAVNRISEDVDLFAPCERRDETLVAASAASPAHPRDRLTGTMRDARGR